MDELTTALIPLVVAILLLGLCTTVVYERRRRRRAADLAEGMLRQGFQPVPDALPLIRRIRRLLEPLDYLVENEKGGSAFTASIGKREAIFIEWSYDSPGGVHGSTFHVDQRAYVILGPGAPYLRALPKVIFGKPVNSIDIGDDPAFFRTFWLEGSDREAIRHCLGKELRDFLLARGSPWRFHAGPEGVTLLCGGNTPRKEVSRIRATLEQMATLTETQARW
jgi:hypothetical protein